MSLVCPGEDALQRLIAGDSTGQDAIAVERHVGECASCQATIEALLAEESHGLLPIDQTELGPVAPYLERLRQAPWSILASRLPASDAAALAEERDGDSSASRPLPELPGYEILSELGRGGMGVVYKARLFSLNRLVALKMILSGVHAGTHAEARFRAEAEAIARLHHPNIVLIYHVAEHDGRPFLEMEYLEGGSLADRLRGEPMDPQEAAMMVVDLSSAVDAAHQAGIIHRDLKPANILLSREGVPKVADFGLAKLMDSGSALTYSDALLGSPSYMAPEQAEGNATDLGPAVDIHALGVLLYEMLTGRPPFRGATVAETLEHVRLVDPLAPSRLVPRLPRDLETITLKCLEKTPSRRYGSARELAEDLERYLEGQSILARRASVAERAAKWARRRPTIAALFLLSIGGSILLIGGGAYYNSRLLRSNQNLTLAVHRARSAELLVAASAKVATEERDLALRTLNTLVFEVQDKLGKSPSTRGVQRDILNVAVKGLTELARRSSSMAPDKSRAEAHLKLAFIHDQLGQSKECRHELDQTNEICEAIVASGRDTPETRALHARALLLIGNQQLTSSRVDDAIGRYRQGLLLVADDEDRATPQEPSRPLTMDLLDRLSLAYLLKEDERQARAYGEQYHRMVLAWAERRPEDRVAHVHLANSHLSLSLVAKNTGNEPEAVEHTTRCEDICRRLRATGPADAQLLDTLYGARNIRARLLADQGDLEAARECYNDTRTLLLSEESRDPENRHIPLNLAVIDTSLGNLDLSEDRFAEAARHFAASHERLTRLERAGNLDDQYTIRQVYLPGTARLLELCKAAEQVFDKQESAERFPVVHRSYLLCLRVRQLASRRGMCTDLLDTATRVCRLEASGHDDLLAKAIACVRCGKVIQELQRPCSGVPGTEATLRLCREQAVETMRKAFPMSPFAITRLEHLGDYRFLRDDPEIKALIAREKNKSSRSPTTGEPASRPNSGRGVAGL